MSEPITRYGEPAVPFAIAAIKAWQANKSTSFTPTDILNDCGDAILAALIAAQPQRYGRLSPQILIEVDDLALRMINAERERYILPPLLPSALSDPSYDRVKYYARIAIQHVAQPQEAPVLSAVIGWDEEAALQKIAYRDIKIQNLQKALAEISNRTYSSDRRCRLDYVSVAEINDIANSALNGRGMYYPQATPVTRGPDCACCEQQPRKDCTVPGCTMKDVEWALPVQATRVADDALCPHTTAALTRPESER